MTTIVYQVARERTFLRGREIQRQMSSSSTNVDATTVISFPEAEVRQTIAEVLRRHLDHVGAYDPKTCSRLTKDLCVGVKREVRRQLADASAYGPDRYKLVVSVVLGEDKDESVQLATRCVVDRQTDSLTSYVYRNASIYAVCVVFGLLHTTG